MCNRFSIQQGTHNFTGFTQTRVALAFFRPVKAYHTLVDRFATPNRHLWQATWKHLPKRRDGLSQNCGVIAPAPGHRYDAKTKPFRLRQSSAEPCPRKARLPLRRSPWLQMVRGNCRIKPCSLGLSDITEELARRKLFVRDVITDPAHGTQ